jgi:hypothetical protein
MTEIVPFRRKAPSPVGAIGNAALAMKRPDAAISPKLRRYALAWLLRKRAALRRRLLISMPDQIRWKLEAEIGYIDGCIASVPAQDETQERKS